MNDLDTGSWRAGDTVRVLGRKATINDFEYAPAERVVYAIVTDDQGQPWKVRLTALKSWEEP